MNIRKHITVIRVCSQCNLRIRQSRITFQRYVSTYNTFLFYFPFIRLYIYFKIESCIIIADIRLKIERHFIGCTLFHRKFRCIATRIGATQAFPIHRGSLGVVSIIDAQIIILYFCRNPPRHTHTVTFWDRNDHVVLTAITVLAIIVFTISSMIHHAKMGDPTWNIHKLSRITFHPNSIAFVQSGE